MKALNEKFHSAVVTGGTQGLGKAIVHVLQSQGVSVVDISRSGSVRADLTNPLSLRKIADLIESEEIPCDLLINNAAYGLFGELESFSQDQMDSQLTLALNAPIVLSQAAYKVMKRRGQGTIVNVSSLAAPMPIPYMSLYNVAKGGLTNFSKSLMLEAEETGVRVMDFQLGDTQTQFHEAMEKNIHGAGAKAALDAMIHHMTMGPKPEKAALVLKKMLQRNKSGVYRFGTAFQAFWAPLAFRFLPTALQLYFIKKYYKL